VPVDRRLGVAGKEDQVSARSSTRLERSSRRALVALLAAAFLVLAVMVGVLAIAGAWGRDGANGGAPYRGSEPPARFTLPSFDLPTYDGGRVTSRDVRGRVVLLTLLDSQCMDACPILASVIARAVDRLEERERAQVRALALSSDPVEDTPASVRRFLASQGAVGRLEYLVGEERQLRPLWNALQVLPSADTGRDTLHSAPLRIYDRDGVWVATLHAGADLSQANLLHDIRYALGASGDSSR
jgi:cytochrome oxidase Cu insertion factor (SCO1/SenC/PrrC family)